MKKIFAVLFLLGMISAHAQELSFGDLNYFLKQGQFNLKTDINFVTYEERIGDASESYTFETEGYYVDAGLSFGLSDKLNLFVAGQYLYSVEVARQKPDGASYSIEGFTNPSLGGVLRVLNQSDSGVNLDLGAVARIRLQDAERGSSVSPNKDGNSVEARNAYELNARVGKKWDNANEWQLSAGAVHHTSGEYKKEDSNFGTTDEKVDQDSSTDFFVKAAYQYRPVNEFMLNVAMLGTRVGDTSAEGKESDDEFDYDSRIEYDFIFNAKYLVSENVIFKFNFKLACNPDFDGEIAGSDVEIDKRRESAYGVGLDFLF